MESMGSKKPRRRRSFTAEFKAEIVDLCQRGDRSVGQVAKGFDLTADTYVRPAECMAACAARPRRPAACTVCGSLVSGPAAGAISADLGVAPGGMQGRSWRTERGILGPGQRSPGRT
jgi:hypothetical protein